MGQRIHQSVVLAAVDLLGGLLTVGSSVEQKSCCPTVLRAAGSLGWVRIWCLLGSQLARSLPQQKGVGGRILKDGRGEVFRKVKAFVGGGSQVHRAPSSSSGTLDRQGRLLLTVLCTVGPQGWVRI